MIPVSGAEFLLTNPQWQSTCTTDEQKTPCWYSPPVKTSLPLMLFLLPHTGRWRSVQRWPPHPPGERNEGLYLKERTEREQRLGDPIICLPTNPLPTNPFLNICPVKPTSTCGINATLPSGLVYHAHWFKAGNTTYLTYCYFNFNIKKSF